MLRKSGNLDHGEYHTESVFEDRSVLLAIVVAFSFAIAQCSMPDDTEDHKNTPSDIQRNE